MPTSVRVLVVEDEWLIAHDHAANLRDGGHHVVGPFATAGAALAAAKEGGVDVALLDVQLGDGTSLALAELLRERGIPFAFVSGYTDPQHLPAGMEDAELLAKPTEPASLLRTVDRLARRNGG